MAQCTAHAKRTGELCKAAAVTGSTKCRVHGGMTPRGMASPQYKHGKYTDALPVRLQDRFEAKKDDKQLLSLREDIALVETRLEDVLSRVDTGESGANWKALKACQAQLKGARQTGDALGVAFALNEMESLISKGYSDYVAWSEVISLVQKRATLAAMERKQLMEARQFVTVTQAMAAMQSLIESVKEHVDNLGLPEPQKRDFLGAVQREFLRHTGVPERQLNSGRAG